MHGNSTIDRLMYRYFILSSERPSVKTLKKIVPIKLPASPVSAVSAVFLIGSWFCGALLDILNRESDALFTGTLWISVTSLKVFDANSEKFLNTPCIWSKKFVRARFNFWDKTNVAITQIEFVASRSLFTAPSGVRLGVPAPLKFCTEHCRHVGREQNDDETDRPTSPSGPRNFLMKWPFKLHRPRFRQFFTAADETHEQKTLELKW